MGIYMRLHPPGPHRAEISVIGFVLMMAAIIFGGDIAKSEYWGPMASWGVLSSEGVTSLRFILFSCFSGDG